MGRITYLVSPTLCSFARQSHTSYNPKYDESIGNVFRHIKAAVLRITESTTVFGGGLPSPSASRSCPDQPRQRRVELECRTLFCIASLLKREQKA